MQIMIRANADLKGILQEESKRIGITMNALILQILWGWVDRKEKADRTVQGYGSIGLVSVCVEEGRRQDCHKRKGIHSQNWAGSR